MRICLEKIPDKFHPDPIWNDRAFGFFYQVEQCSPQQQNEQDE